MAGYFDASLLLAACLDQIEHEEFIRIWDAESIRVSSELVKAECIVSVRRAGAVRVQRKPELDSESWAAQRLATSDAFLESLSCKSLDSAVTAIVRSEPRLADCRTLDAVHMATALWFQPHLDEPLRICTLDKRLRALALGLGFSVLPERMPEEGKQRS